MRIVGKLAYEFVPTSNDAILQVDEILNQL